MIKTTTQVAWIVGEREESVNILTGELSALNCMNVYDGDEASFLNSEDKGDPPDVIFVHMSLLTDQHFSDYVRFLYPDVPVIVLCEHDELLFALEAVGSKADNYLIRSSKNMDKIDRAICFASYRITDHKLHGEYVKWFHTLIPQAIMDVANVMFFVNYEEPESQTNSQVRNAVTRVFEDLDDVISKRLLNI